MTGCTAQPSVLSATKNVVLVGNPNVGKSVLFKNLTSHYVVVANYPGTTVEIIRANSKVDGAEFTVCDTPGLNDLRQISEDAKVTTRVLTEDLDTVIVQVADAKNLRRALLLTMQLAELKRPMVLVLNMFDELEERGGKIDVSKLSEILRIPVVPTVAPIGRGTEDLLHALKHAAIPKGDWIPEHDSAHASLNQDKMDRVNGILAETYTLDQPEKAPFRVKLGFWAMHRFLGLGFAAAALVTVFWFVGLFGAGTMVDFLEVGVFQHHVNPVAIKVVDAALPFSHSHATEQLGVTIGFPITPVNEVEIANFSRTVTVPEYLVTDNADPGALSSFNRFVHDFLVGEFGAITMALSYAFAIVLPIVTTFFLVFSILEDSGYFPRMSIMVNRVFKWMGLNGKAVLPMILGLGCDTMATMTTRILDTRRERLITTVLLALAVPCSAQLGVLLALMATLSAQAAAIWLTVVVAVILVVGWLTNQLFKSEPSDFILEIPPMRRPQLDNVVIKTVSRLNWYLKEVIPLFVLGTAILFVLDRLKLLAVIVRAGEPLVTGWLGLPAETTNAFLIGFLRRDFGAVYLLDAATGADPILNAHQVLVAMITITLFIPCIANLLVIAKENGRKVALQMAVFIFPFAFLVGGIINHVGLWLSST